MKNEQKKEKKEKKQKDRRDRQESPETEVSGDRKSSKAERAKATERIEYSIIAGELKGRKMSVPDLGLTRPPLTRLRKSIFDFLNPFLEEAAYLDLFSGSGSYLFEAVSRHASRVIGVERAAALAEAINAQAVKHGVEGRLTCRCQDVFKVIPDLSEREFRFDIIMIAPPQYLDLVSKTLEKLRKFPLIRPGGIILSQHDSSETKSINLNGFELRQHRKYGNTTYTILNG